MRCSLTLPAGVATLLAVSSALSAAAHQRFEVATFNATPEFSTDHYNQAMFDKLNVVSPFGGYHFAMGSDDRRSQITAKGNTLAVYHNSLTGVYTDSGHDPIVAAQQIDFYVQDRFTQFGAGPTWITINEISPSLWTNSTATGATYRAWLVDTMARLDNDYGYNIVVFSPFSNPGANDASWQGLSAHAYIGVENYLSGEEVRDSGFSVAWAQQQYQSSKTSYMNRGVPEDRIFIAEHFGQTLAGTDWGRAGVSADDWEHAIRVRDEAFLNADVAGFLSYAWGKNGMQVSDAELMRFETAHMEMPVLQSEIPEPSTILLAGVAALLQRRRVRRPKDERA